MKFDKLVETIAGLGVPGLVLLFAMTLTGYAGAAAITTALAALGGPFGMLGGIGLLVLLALISKALSKWGIEKIAKAVIQKLIEKSETKEGILEKIESYWFISKDLKLKIKDYIEKFFESQ
ncbi:hypothetical protein ES703_62025 [subsurface metagenome]